MPVLRGRGYGGYRGYRVGGYQPYRVAYHRRPYYYGVGYHGFYYGGFHPHYAWYHPYYHVGVVPMANPMYVEPIDPPIIVEPPLVLGPPIEMPPPPPYPGTPGTQCDRIPQFHHPEAPYIQNGPVVNKS
ncbi:unnamed protein product [Caenorhabditis bovis]|uniref:Uncharacterized protein n=1 Tax=Caenorhabditis bovis TaxID=2654633 RepID=A0A8S1EF58_9PELO|nr:unnamed protein product [Caenorhabditis bovis]